MGSGSASLSSPCPSPPSLPHPHPTPLPLPPPVAIACLSLHWANDLPGVMARARRALKPGGLFLASLLGGDTLAELRGSFAAAEVEVASGVSPRASPTVRVRDAGSLLSRAGLVVPGVDVDEIVVRYAGGPAAVVDHVRAMAGSNAVAKRARALPRAVAAAALARYAADHGDAAGAVPATFEVITMTGWAPAAGAPGGPAPAVRGSATASFADLAAALTVRQGGEKDGGGEKA